MIEAITFDLDGVYFPNGKKNFLNSLAELGVAASEAKRVFLDSPEMNAQYKVGKLNDDQYWSWAVEQWGLDMTPREVVKLLISGYEVDSNVVNTIKRVRQLGYKTLVCSNNFPARVNGLQERFSFLDDFDAAVFSHEVGATKPSNRIFSELIAKAGVEASAIVFADDNSDNVLGAQQVGITAFAYQGFDDFTDRLQRLGLAL